MSDEELRIAIAEACGHKSVHWQRGQLLSKWGSLRYYDPVPDYPNNLDAMLAAEKTLAGKDELESHYFWVELPKACGSQHHQNATARQRALAFYQTITKK